MDKVIVVSITTPYYKNLPNSASNLEEAKTKTLEYLNGIPGNEDITNNDIQIDSGTLNVGKRHGTQYVTANSRSRFGSTFGSVLGKFRDTDAFVVFIPEKFKFLPDTPATTDTLATTDTPAATDTPATNSSFSTGGYRRYKKKRTARKTTRRGKKSNRRTRGKK